MTDNHEDLHEYDFEGFQLSGDGEVPRSITDRTTRRLFGGLCLAAVLMAALLSNLFLREVRGLPPGDVEDRIVNYSERWNGLMNDLRFDYPVASMKEYVESWQNVSWDDVDCLIVTVVRNVSFVQDQEDSLPPASGCSE